MLGLDDYLQRNLKLHRSEFNNLMDLGIIQPAKKLVFTFTYDPEKKKSRRVEIMWRLSSLNDITVPDHIQDFTLTLNGATLCSKVNLVRAYHQIPVEFTKLHRLTTLFGLF